MISKEEFDAVTRATDEMAPRILPPTWTCYGYLVPGQMRYQNIYGLRVIFSADPILEPGKMWLHVSMSYENKLPSYNDMCHVKKIFIGEERQAVQVFPPASKHINIHPFCLHLWSCIEGDGLPDFGREGTI